MPNHSLGNAFHWHPDSSPYMTASKTWRAGLGGRPAPGLREYCVPAGRSRTGINGSTRAQKSSVTIHESTRLRVVMHSSSHRTTCGPGRKSATHGQVLGQPPPSMTVTRGGWWYAHQSAAGRAAGARFQCVARRRPKKLKHRLPLAAATPKGATPAQGSYIANAYIGCQGADLSGGKIPGAPLNSQALASLRRLSGCCRNDAQRQATRRRGGPNEMPSSTFSANSAVDLLGTHLSLKLLPTLPARPPLTEPRKSECSKKCRRCAAAPGRPSNTAFPACAIRRLRTIQASAHEEATAWAGASGSGRNACTRLPLHCHSGHAATTWHLSSFAV